MAQRCVARPSACRTSTGTRTVGFRKTGPASSADRFAAEAEGLVEHFTAVLKDNGNQLLPDTHAKTGEVVLQRLYTVTFDAVDLWGPEANPRDSVCLDLWESYLDAI